MNIEKLLQSVERVMAEAKAIKAEILKESMPKPAPGFDEFWGAYPLHVRQVDAERSWAINVKEEDVKPILAALKNKEWGERKYIPAPDRWLTGKRWRDEEKLNDHGKYEGLSETFSKPQQ